MYVSDLLPFRLVMKELTVSLIETGAGAQLRTITVAAATRARAVILRVVFILLLSS